MRGVPVYPVGCAGVITHSEPLPDGRFNIVLRGLEKFRMTGEDTSQPYRLAHIEAVPEVATDADCATIKKHRQRLEALLAAAADIAAPRCDCRRRYRIRISSMPSRNTRRSSQSSAGTPRV